MIHPPFVYSSEIGSGPSTTTAYPDGRIIREYTCVRDPGRFKVLSEAFDNDDGN